MNAPFPVLFAELDKSTIVYLIIGVFVLVVAAIIFSFFSVWLRASLLLMPV